jgi:tetratricopeptide (TPR) repeat protein
MIQAAIGFYFTDEAPTNTPFKIGLFNYAIDIPPGASDLEVRDTYTLAADAEVLSVLPHAHYLGKELSAFATLPDGKQQRLLHIANWDFNWQGEYLFQKPILLPRGTTLSMIWHYDNSTNNARNPHNPPQRVQYGLQSSDEMAELWLQVLPVRKGDLDALAQYDQPRVFKAAIDYNQYLIARDPNNARAHTELGKAQLFLGKYAEAHATLNKSAALDPRFDEPHYFLGVLYRMHNRLAEAAAEFTAAVQRNPENARAHGSLGIVLMNQGDFDNAEPHLRTALRLNPQDQIAKESLEQLASLRARRLK